MIDSEASLHVSKATEPPAVKIPEINLRSCRRESNPRCQHDERASYPLGHRGSLCYSPCGSTVPKRPMPFGIQLGLYFIFYRRPTILWHLLCRPMFGIDFYC